MKMHRILSIGVLGAVFLTLAVATPWTAAADEDQINHPACQYCGMNRTKFAHSRALVTYNDGTAVGTCSLHCAAIDLSLKIDKTPVAIMVADYNTKKLTDADAAHWVIGGDKMGVMTRRAKWAFASRADADAFVAAHGGSPAVFSAAVKSAFEDMYADLQMIREKRKKMRAMKSQMKKD
jgi:nitrous oxide reductase accessory protein NosL